MIKGEYFAKMGQHHMMAANNMQELKAAMLARYTHIIKDTHAIKPFRYEPHLYKDFAVNNPGYGADWTYGFNTWGMRQLHEPLKDVDVSYYGCSFTWGVGVPDSAVWTHQLNSRVGWTRSNNWGLRGISTEECVNLFAVTSQFVTMRHAVFMIPGLNRILQAFESGKDSEGLKEWTYKYITGEHDTVNEDSDVRKFSKDYYLLPHEYFFEKVLRDLSLIGIIARTHNIQVHVCSWSRHDYIFDQLNWPHVGWIKNMPTPDQLGLDQRHPGCDWHTRTAAHMAQTILGTQ